MPYAAHIHYFSIDDEFLYEPFFQDFGPLNLAMTFRYCKLLDAKMKDPSLADKIIIHHCRLDPKKRANAAYLIGAYQVIVQGISAENAYEPFQGANFGGDSLFLPFRDSSDGLPCEFGLTILDCLKGLEKSIELGWFNWQTFDCERYEFLEKVENGDMTWIVPQKLLAFAGPSPTNVDEYGFPALTPEDFVPIFKNEGICLVVRLNKKEYDPCRFMDHGIGHVDFSYGDGSCPDRRTVSKFLRIMESEPGGVAVHCKAGLGRTQILGAMYVMKKYKFPARALIGWCRICRPGSILGSSQQFLCDMQDEMFDLDYQATLGIDQDKGLGDCSSIQIETDDMIVVQEMQEGKAKEKAGEESSWGSAKNIPASAPLHFASPSKRSILRSLRPENKWSLGGLLWSSRNRGSYLRCKASNLFYASANCCNSSAS